MALLSTLERDFTAFLVTKERESLPGPGQYELDKSKNVTKLEVKKRISNAAFGKSTKQEEGGAFSKKSFSPGPGHY